MRARRFLNTFLGPFLAAGTASVALASTTQAQSTTPGVVAPLSALLAMLGASVGMIAWSRRDRRRAKRALTYKRCQCCGNPMRGAVDAQRGSILRCVECLRQEAVCWMICQ